MKSLAYILKSCLVIFTLFLVFALSVSANITSNKQHAEKYITESLKLRLEKMNVYQFGCSEKEIFDIIDRVMKSNPDFYYVENKFYYTTDASGIVDRITPSYVYSAREIKNIKSFCDNEIEKILFSVDERMSDFQKVLSLHEYMCDNFEYDESFESRNMYDLLRTKKGTCQAFTLTYMELLSRLGIDASYAYSNEIMHIWNLVKLEDEWYHVDLTWDNVDSGVSHKNFLLTDAQILEVGHRGAINADGIQCNGEKYSALALQESPYRYVAFLDGFIYIDNISRNVCFDRLDGSEKESLYRVDELWEKGEGRYYANAFSTPIAAGDKVYFNTKNKIMEIDSALNVRALRELDFNAFGMAYDKGVLCYLDRGHNESVGLDISRSLDSDGDGEVTVLDVAALDAHLNRREVFVYKYNVDANEDFMLDAKDLEALRQYLLIDKRTIS